jgi:hypothetical protein
MERALTVCGTIISLGVVALSAKGVVDTTGAALVGCSAGEIAFGLLTERGAATAVFWWRAM